MESEGKRDGVERDGAPRSAGRLVPLLLPVLVAAVYARTVGHDAVMLDDMEYLVSTPVSGGLSAAGAAWAFTTFTMANWHPLAWISHMLDVSLFGLEHPGGHHAVSFLIHGGSAYLLYRFLRDATGSPYRSLFAAALFAVHPVHVESVAWISERKDLLSGLFFILSLHAYLRFVRAPSAGRYAALLLAFGASLLSKPMAVTLPPLLLLLDAWPLGRTPLAPPADGSPHAPRPWGALLMEKVPLLLLSAASSAVTVVAQREGGALRDFAANPPLQRLGNAVVSTVSYLGKLVYPADLAVFYPVRTVGAAEVIGAALLLSALTFAFLRRRRSRPFLPVGWFWFLGMLVPVSGLVQVGGQAMADRYAYLPFIGLYVMAAWGIPSLPGRIVANRAALAAAGAATVAILGSAAFVQAGYWKDSEKLFLRTLAITGPNADIGNNLGVYYYQRLGRSERAIELFREALAIEPGFYNAAFNLAAALSDTGRADLALPHVLTALTLQPRNAAAMGLAGEVRERLGNREEAMSWYRKALAVDPAEVRSVAGMARLGGGG